MHLSAQQIDRFEFQRDSDDALARALEYARQKRADDRAKMLGVEISNVPNKRLFERWDQDEAEQPARAQFNRKVKDEHSRRSLQNRPAKRAIHRATAKAGPGNRYGQGKQYTINGETKNLRAWSEHVGISYNSVIKRMSRGQTVEQALFQPDKRKGAGAVRSLAPHQETGGVSVAQDTDNLGFFPQ